MTTHELVVKLLGLDPSGDKEVDMMVHDYVEEVTGYGIVQDAIEPIHNPDGSWKVRIVGGRK